MGKRRSSLLTESKRGLQCRNQLKDDLESYIKNEETSETEYIFAHKRPKKSTGKSKAWKNATKKDSSSNEEGGGEIVEKSKSKGKKVRESDSSDAGKVRHRKSNKKKSRNHDSLDSNEED